MESNLDGDSVATMEEIDLINKGCSSTDIYGLSNSKLIGVDGSVSLVIFLVTDINYYLQNSRGDDTGLCHVVNYGIGGNDTSLCL